MFSVLGITGAGGLPGGQGLTFMPSDRPGSYTVTTCAPPGQGGALTPEQKRQLINEGFIVIKGVVPREVLWPAMREVNRALGDKTEGTRDTEFSSKLTQHPAIAALYNNAQVIAAVESVIGGTHHVGGGQIALRYPGDHCGPDYKPWPKWETHWHIDGLASAHNPNTPPGQIHNFTALVGVLLADVKEPLSGNLTVYPGSHYELQEHFRREGFEGVKSLGQGGLPKTPFTRPAVQVVGEAGDIVIANYMVAHTIAPNISPFIRYCVYFRCHSRSIGQPWGQHRPSSMLYVWSDWAGLQRTIQQMESERAAKVPPQQVVVAPSSSNPMHGGGGPPPYQPPQPRVLSEEEQLAEALRLSMMPQQQPSHRPPMPPAPVSTGGGREVDEEELLRQVLERSKIER